MKYLILFYFLLGYIGTKSYAQPLSKKQKIEINLNQEKTYKVGNLFSSMDYIFLEEKEDLLGYAKKIERDGNFIFIYDSYSNSILKFNNKGKFLSKLSKEGEGPGEYTEIAWFTLDKKNKWLYLYSENQGKVIQYDYNFRFKNEKKMGLFVHSIEILSSGDFLVFSNDTRQSNINSNISIFNARWEFMDDFLTINPTYERISYDFDNYMSAYNEELLTFLTFRNKIYGYKNRMAYEKYEFDFGQSNILPSHVNGKFIENIIPIIKKEGLVYITGFVETENHLYLRLEDFGNGYQIIYSKNTLENKVIKNIKMETDLFGLVSTSWDNKLVGFLNSEHLEQIYSAYQAMDVSIPKVLEEWAKKGKNYSLLTLGTIQNN